MLLLICNLLHACSDAYVPDHTHNHAHNHAQTHNHSPHTPTNINSQTALTFETFDVTFIERLVRRYYLQLPTIHTPFFEFGGWEGMAEEEVCAHLSPGTSVGTWIQVPHECELRIVNRVRGFVHVMEMLAACVLVWFLCRCCTRLMDECLGHLCMRKSSRGYRPIIISHATHGPSRLSVEPIVGRVAYVIPEDMRHT